MFDDYDYDDVTCEFGYFPYCPLCDHGYTVHEDWMLDDVEEWHCILAEEKGFV